LAEGQPPLWGLAAYLLLVFFCVGILFGNLNAIAMEPLGHIAGVGAAVVGSLSMAISVAGGSLIGQAYNGTVLPLVAGFGTLSLAALAAMRWTAAGAGASTGRTEPR
jgi:DHA1 family bicyclomycin/chloramphenicol resistance-like MFS transporter